MKHKSFQNHVCQFYWKQKYMKLSLPVSNRAISLCWCSITSSCEWKPHIHMPMGYLTSMSMKNSGACSWKSHSHMLMRLATARPLYTNLLLAGLNWGSIFVFKNVCASCPMWKIVSPVKLLQVFLEYAVYVENAEIWKSPREVNISC